MKIREEQIIEAYEKFRDYYFENEEDFSNKKQAHVVKEVKQRTIQNTQYSWNNASLTDYINTLIYMVKGEQFARTINKFSKNYLIENICKDFSEEICENAKRSLGLHEKYYAGVIERNKSAKKSFYGLWISRSEDPQKIIESGIWKNNLSNTKRLDGQIEQLKIDDRVFLYQNIGDVPIEETPFFSYVNENRYVLDSTLTTVKSWAIGVVTNINFDTHQLEIEWDANYNTNEWYGYTRQDGVWTFEVDEKNTLQQRKYKKLYAIVFDGEKQDYKWWFDNGILEKRKDDKKQNRKSTMNTKNIILYGSPGVGKTHNTNKLIQLIENGNSDREIFEIIKNNERSESIDISDMEERVKFVTFHQSFGYEDFIEGFRPNEDGIIEIQEGIFKRIVQDAEDNLIDSKAEDSVNINIDELIKKFTNHVQDTLDKDEVFYLDENKITIESINNRGSFLLGGSIKSNTQRLALDMVKRDYGDYKTGRIASYEDIKPKYESERVFHGNARYYYLLYRKLYEYEKTLDIQTIKPKNVELKNFYLVIDEINRGNISKIFGELITLIEEDKRYKLEAILPYSKTPFKIPSNLYIIGTMNSTDKSIALIDIALRRRFTFLKMEPNADLIKDRQARQIFENLNHHITKELGEDYQIGHSYFMGEIDLSFVLEYKIKPLLEEYFYGDTKGLKEAFELLEQ